MDSIFRYNKEILPFVNGNIGLHVSIPYHKFNRNYKFTYLDYHLHQYVTKIIKTKDIRKSLALGTEIMINLNINKYLSFSMGSNYRFKLPSYRKISACADADYNNEPQKFYSTVKFKNISPQIGLSIRFK